MGLIASLRRSRTEPMVESTAAPAASKPAKKEDDYRQRKLTRLMNPFQITIKRTTLPSSLQQFMKEPAGTEEKKVDFFADNSATSMTVSELLIIIRGTGSRPSFQGATMEHFREKSE